MYNSFILSSMIDIENNSHLITITGRFVSDVLSIRLGDHDCKIKATSKTVVKCRIADLMAGVYVPQVLTKSGFAVYGNEPDEYSIDVTGEVTYNYPTMSSFAGGNSISLYGSGFSANMTIMMMHEYGKDTNFCKIGECKIQYFSSQLVKVDLPPLRGVKGKESVKTSIVLTGYNTLTGKSIKFNRIDFTYENSKTARISSLTTQYVDTVRKGDLLSIHGENFDPVCEHQRVEVANNENHCELIVCKPDVLVCRLPPHPAGLARLSVKHYLYGYDKSYSFIDYDYDITQVFPLSGGRIGGNDIILSGFGLGNWIESSVTVTICGKECRQLSFDDLETIQVIRCTVPAPVYAGSTHNCDIVIFCKSCLTDDITYSEQYEYKDSLTPKITGVDLPYGPSIGGYDVTFFTENIIDTEVIIDNLNCTSTTVMDGEISCSVGSHEMLTYQQPEIRFPNQGQAVMNTSDSFELIDRWSSSMTWGCISSDHCKPIHGDLVEIPKGSRILLDESPPKLKAILISGGILKVEDKDIELNLEYLIITNGGKLIIGTEDKPINASIKINLHGDMASQQLPLYGSNVIAVHSGSLEIFSRLKTVSTTLQKTSFVNDDIIVVNDNDGWVVGDEIVIATTGGPDSIKENEQRTIKYLDGTTVTLTDPLEYDHTVTSIEYNGIKRYMDAEVINLSRNVKISGVTPEGDMYGGHLVASNETEYIKLSSVEFTRVGQAFQLGKYPIHFHLSGSHPNRNVV